MLQLRFCLVGAGVVVCGVVLHRLDLKEVAAGEAGDHLGHNFGVALGQIFNLPVPIIFSFSGIINNQWFAHLKAPFCCFDFTANKNPQLQAGELSWLNK